MRKKRLFALLLALSLLIAALPAALAENDGEGTAAEEGADGVSYAYEAPAPEIKAVEGKLETASAANAAQLVRGGGQSEAYRYWESSLGHAPQIYRIKKVAVAMLKNAVGRTDDAVPVGYDGIRFQPCFEVPPLGNDEVLQKDLDFNLHGSIYTDSPLASVSAVFAPRGDGKGVSATVTFAPEKDVRAYSLVSKSEPVEGKSLDSLIDISGLSAGKYTFTLSAATAAQSAPVALHTAEIQIAANDSALKGGYKLTQNKFDDNYSEALAFFGDASQFLFTYWLGRASGTERDISTETVWREKNLVDSPFGGRCHVMALPYFEQAKAYIDTSYIKVDVERKGTVREGKVIPLSTIMENDASPYVPRFQSNCEYVSHHCLGTAIDVNDNLYPNKNIITNHELVGDDVRDHLRYDGIETDEKGRQYYSFFYDGTYSSQFKRVPKTIVNYLLYELAFYRAGFQWGFYYETACDGMHFMLSENDRNKHMDSDVGLRKVYEYTNNVLEE